MSFSTRLAKTTSGSVTAASIFALIVGPILAWVGRTNVKTRSASETGVRRLTNSALGMSNDYEGRKAAVVGWIRIVGGTLLTIGGVIGLAVASNM